MATHGDLTGKNKEELAEKAAKAQAERAGSLSMISADADAQLVDEPVVLETNEQKQTRLAAEAAEVAAANGVIEIDDSTEPTKTFRVNTDLEDVTIGFGNTYSFVRGQEYTAPWSIYYHLENLGVVHH